MKSDLYQIEIFFLSNHFYETPLAFICSRTNSTIRFYLNIKSWKIGNNFEAQKVLAIIVGRGRAGIDSKSEQIFGRDSVLPFVIFFS